MRKLKARSATENRQLVMRVVVPRCWFFLLVLTLVFCVRRYLVLVNEFVGCRYALRASFQVNTR